MNLTTNVGRAVRRCQAAVAILGTALSLYGMNGLAQSATSSNLSERVAAEGAEAKTKIQETGQAAVNKVETLWQRIDENRLKNRTRDELVAWVIMGLLVGGLLFRFGKSSQLMSIILGLVGAFIGGMIAHIAQLDFGLGPVLITYEDLICTLAGGVLLLCVGRWSMILKLVKPRA